jgi:hypothetical protein
VKAMTIVKIGDKFGRLTVFAREFVGLFEKHPKRVRFECLCECGKITLVEARYLVSCATRSCGCLKEEYYQRKLGNKPGR